MPRVKKRINKILSTIMTLLLMITQLAGVFTIQTAVAEDQMNPLEKVIRDTINKPTGTLLQEDWDKVTRIDAKWLNITDSSITILSNARNLEYLDLSYNKITSAGLSNLTGLSKIKYLYLRNNSISDIPPLDSPLANLRSLLVLDIRNNNISNISYLSQLTNLKMLYLSSNNISEISSLANLVNLETLEISNNKISNINYLERLTRLSWLDIGANSISDISVVSKLTALNNLYLGNNSIESLTPLKGLSNLRDVNLGVNQFGAYQDNLQDTPDEIIKSLENRGVSVRCNLIVNSPTKNYITNVDKVTITGRAKVGSNLFISGSAVPIDSKGNFSKDVTLNLGVNNINLQVKGSNNAVLQDSEGKDISTEINVYYDKYSLAMTVLAPTNGLAINKNWIFVEGKADKGSSISVMVNGRSTGLPVIADNEGYFTKQVGLDLGENNLVITASKEGSNYSKTYRKIYYDNLPPNLSISVEKTLTNQSTILVTGTTDLESIVKVNGNVAINNGGHFEKYANLVPGENTITVTSTDVAGNIRTEKASVFYDNVPPSLRVLEPLYSNVTVDTSTLKVSGIVEIGSTVRVNGEVVKTNSIGSFNTIIELDNGNNNILITATDKANNVASMLKRIESTAPSIISPENNYRTNHDTVNMIGKATMGTTVTISNETVEIDNLGNFSKVIKLQPGLNLVPVASANETITRKIIYDNVSNLTISSIKDNQRTNKDNIVVSGIGERGGYVNIKVNNIDTGNTTVDSQDKFSKTVSLIPGNNILSITAVDDLGNSITTTRNVFYDNIPPVLNVTSPIDNIRTNKNITVEGTAEAGSVIKVNGNTVTLKNGSFSYVLTSLINGNNNIVITATDDVGNVTTITRKVDFDNLPPNITINNPSTDMATRNDIISVEGFTEKDAILKINNEIVTLDQNGKFNKTINLSNGTNLITFTANDSLGNTNVIKRNVVLDKTAPVGYIVTPIYGNKVYSKPIFTVSWYGKDSGPTMGISSYDIQYYRDDSNSWTDWKIGTISTSADFKGEAGHTYYFRVRARDMANNLGEWSTSTYRYVVPYDGSNTLISKKSGFKGIYRYSKSNYYQGTLIYSSKANESITYKFYGDEIGLVSTKNSKLSKARIYIDGKYLLTVDAYSKYTYYRQVIFRGHWKTMGNHTITIVNEGTKGRSRFEIDGLIVGRR